MMTTSSNRKQVAESVITGKREKEYVVDKEHFYLLQYMNEVFAYVEDNIDCEWKAFKLWCCRNRYKIPKIFEEKLLALSEYSLIYKGTILS